MAPTSIAHLYSISVKRAVRSLYITFKQVMGRYCRGRPSHFCLGINMVCPYTNHGSIILLGCFIVFHRSSPNNSTHCWKDFPPEPLVFCLFQASSNSYTFLWLSTIQHGHILGTGSLHFFRLPFPLSQGGIQWITVTLYSHNGPPELGKLIYWGRGFAGFDCCQTRYPKFAVSFIGIFELPPSFSTS